MKIITIATLGMALALLAQDPSQVIIQMNQMGPFVASGAEFVAGELVGGNPVQGAPYSAQALTETSQTLAEGGRIGHKSVSMVYRDSMGRERREVGPMIMISDPVAGASYTLDPNSRTAHKMPISMSMRKTVDGNVTFQSGISVSGSLIAPPPGGETHRVMVYKSVTGTNDTKLPAPTVEQLGTNNIEGVLAEGTRTTVTIPKGQVGNDQDLHVVSERWFSPELKMTVQSKHYDPRTGTTEYRLTQINRSEPAATLFQVPANYTVMDSPAMFTEKIKTKQE